jgi:beta-mannosidase
MWSLNDNWPVISWAAVDGAGIRKPLWYALRDLYADRFMTIQPRPDQDVERPTLVLHNDSATPWHGQIKISRRRTIGGGESLAEQQVSLDLEPRAATAIVINDDVLSASEREQEYLVAAEDSATAAYWYFVEDPQLRLANPAECVDTEVERTASGYAVRVSASSLVKDLALFPDRLDPAARVDTALVTLDAGQSHTFRVASALELDPAMLARKPVLRSTNDLVAR